MARPHEVVRSYKMSDAEMLQASRIYFNLFEADKDLFTAFDPSFAGRDMNSWLSKIEAAENAARDLSVTDEITRLTNIVEEKMEACRQHFQHMKYFIEKAFPDDSAVQNAFGFGEYNKVRESETKLLPFMKNLQQQVAKYSAELLAVNYTQENIDKIPLLWQELMDADQAQENYKKERPVITQSRINTLNEAWEYVLKVNRASKIIFADNLAKLDQYALPYETYEKKTTETPEPEVGAESGGES